MTRVEISKRWEKLDRETLQGGTMKNRLALAALVLGMAAGSAGIASAQDYRYPDRDGRYDNRDDSRYDNRDGDRDNRYYDRGGDRDDYFRRGLEVARNTGFHDGAEVAREDMWRNKPFNPNPRGRYDDADHGYRSQFGDKHEYREHYSEAYRDGYASAFRQNGNYR